MSMISTRNLVAPLTNKVHIITILLCATAFAALRLSGASVSVQKRQPRKSRIAAQTPAAAPAQAPAQAGTSKFLQYLNQEPVKARNMGTEAAKPQAAHPFDQVIQDAATQPFQKPAKGPAPAPKKRGGLADIEATLGLK